MSQYEREESTDDIDNKAEVIFVKKEESLSSEEPPIEEWSSLVIKSLMSNPKRRLHSEGLYDPGSGEICAKYLRASDSSVLRHPYYNYPAVLDPGIESAVLDPPPSRPPYPDDGCELYLDLCKEHNVGPIHLFYSNLRNSKINLSYYCPSSANVRMMAIALQRNRFVKSFDLSDNYMNIDACYHLGKMLKHNIKLDELIMRGCKIGEVGLKNLIADIPSNYVLTKINLSRNDLGDSGGELFARIIDSNAELKQIDLSYNKLGVRTATALHEVLEEKNILTHLNLSWNSFIHIGSTVKFLTTLAATSGTLEELNLSYTGLEGDRIAKAIAEVTCIETLKVLNISDNRFNDDCAAILVEKLAESKLHTYNLSNNVFSPTGACKILLKLRQAKVKLKNLYLDNICVNKTFMNILERIRNMKSRRDFVVTYDKVLHDWVAIGDDPRRLILRRGEYMGRMKKRNPKDVPMFLYSLSYAADCIRAKEFIVMMKDQKIPVNDDWVDGLIKAFPGPIVDQKPTVDSAKMRDYIKRLWPDLKLPPDWKPPVMIRVDVKRKKQVQKSKSKLAIGKKK